MDALYHTNIPGLPEPRRGKVRDVYEVGDKLAVVASDRISCFDVILPTPVADKGRVLTRLSVHWFGSVVDTQHHLITADISEMPAPLCDTPELEGRTMYCERCEVFPIECIVRGYLAGSGVTQYEKTGAVSGVPLPAGLKKFSQLPEPIFTPSTKAAPGEKDENIDFDTMVATIGAEWAERLRDESVALYKRASEQAAANGVLIADTKLEWGQKDGELVLIDEVLTPDSSRFWPADTYVEGQRAESFDKQYVRDWLLSTGWDKTPATAPELPADLVEKTRGLYHRVVEMLTGEPLR